MSEKYFPFMSVNGDRKYSADDWAEYFAMFLGTGIFYSSADKLKVIANNGMIVRVMAGAAFVVGRGYILDSYMDLTLPTADGVLPRIDRIVLCCDYADRSITLQIKSGVPDASPVASGLQRDADVYEVALADILVGQGVLEITNADITDCRLNSSLCGIVTGLVEQADTTDIYNQFSAYLSQFETVTQKDIENWTEQHKDEYIAWYQEQQTTFKTWYETNTASWITKFEDWFAQVKGRMTEDTAAKLNQEVIDINTLLENHQTAIDLNKPMKTVQTVFNTDGSITERGDGWKRDTVFYTDGSIKVIQVVGDEETVVNITFNEDGSISEVVE